jgi:hypothetical protein
MHLWGVCIATFSHLLVFDRLLSWKPRNTVMKLAFATGSFILFDWMQEVEPKNKITQQYVWPVHNVWFVMFDCLLRKELETWKTVE